MPAEQRDDAAEPRERDDFAALVEVRAVDLEARRLRVEHAEAAPPESREQQLRRAVAAMVVALGLRFRLVDLAARRAERDEAQHTGALKEVALAEWQMKRRAATDGRCADADVLRALEVIAAEDSDHRVRRAELRVASPEQAAGVDREERVVG